MAEKHKYDYVEVSAKTGENIKFLFEVLSRRMIKEQDDHDSQHHNGDSSLKDGYRTPFDRSETGVKLGSDKSSRKCCF